MSFGRMVVVLMVCASATSSARAADRIEPFDGYTGRSLALWQQSAEPASTPVSIGDDAPSFSYLGADGDWHRFADLARSGPVLLVFGAHDDELRRLEEEGGYFREMGITCVAVMDRRAGAAQSLARRLKLESTFVVADPKCAIGDLFNSIDPLNHRHAPSFFVVDANRRVRAMGRGRIPGTLDLVRESARGLGMALPEGVMSSTEG